MTRTPKSETMCVISIGFGNDLLLPLDKGVALVKLLNGAVECSRDFRISGKVRYNVLPEPLRLELITIASCQIIMPPSQPKLSTRRSPLTTAPVQP